MSDEEPPDAFTPLPSIVMMPCHPPGGQFDSVVAATSAVDAFASLHGYAVITKRSRKVEGELVNVVLACDRHGTLRNNWKLTEETRKKQYARSRKCDCPMEVILRPDGDHAGKWNVEYNGRECKHNHQPSLKASSHPTRRRKQRTPQSLSPSTTVLLSANELPSRTDGLLRSALRGLGATPVSGEDGEWAGRVEGEDVEVKKDEQPSPFRIGQLRATEVRAKGEYADEHDELMSLPDPKPANMDEVERVLKERYLDALKRGLPSGEEANYLVETLRLTMGAFRLEMDCDPPVKVEPLRVRLKPGATPTKCSLRRQAPIHNSYMKEHIAALAKGGLVRRNPRSRWASPPRVVPKSKPGEYRMVVDVRGVNERTEPMPWPMSILEVLLTFLVLAICYFQLDGDKMFWQLPLHALSQELFTILTAYGMYSPTRVLMGQTDAPAFCQQTMEKIFASQLHHELLVWMDDLLGHAQTPMRLMENLRRTLMLCIEYGVKINPTKCIFFTREARWCGRVISAAGVGHSPERISGLVEMATPKTGADLQQFLCAVNWMRMSIPNYTTIVAPLMALLEVAAKQSGSRKKKKLVRVELLHGLWQTEHQQAYERIKAALAAITPLAHPDAKAIVCVFTDASLDHWGAAVTQLKPGEDLSTITEREHAPLAFLSGSFVGSASRWPIVEKEAFAIVETCKRLEYLLLREGGFRLYTDHRNLVYIFDPHASDASMARYQADKLQRWSMTMMMFRYSIWHISGEENVWGDLLSRWGAKDERGPVTRVGVLAVVDTISPLQMPDFQWPTMAEVLAIQQANLKARDPVGPLPDVVWNENAHAYADAKGKVWVPDDATELQQRFLVIAHAGAAGHRGQATTTKNVQDVFTWSTLAQDVKDFVHGCLHCMSVRGEMIPRPFGETLHATKPNEIIHFDFLSMPLGDDVSKYVLVLKDDMSGFVELIECETADTDEVLSGLLDWFKRFGIVNQWVSDRGSHFKNAVIEDLRRVLGSQHHFVTAYCPWANGTVEVVNNMLLRVVKALMSELKLIPSQWPMVLPVVQAALNSSLSDRLGGVAPLTAFTQLPATTPLKALLHPKTKENVTVDWVKKEHARYLQQTKDALDMMHKTITAEAEKKRLQARARQGIKNHVTMPEFSVGDFVLVGQVLSHANKLALRWRGPRRIVRVVFDRIFDVENLLPPYETTTHHASRLQWFADSKREVTEELLAQARHSEGGYLVEKIVDSRISPATHQPEMKVRWIGLDPLEASWEAATELYKDVPKVRDEAPKKSLEDWRLHHSERQRAQVEQTGHLELKLVLVGGRRHCWLFLIMGAAANAVSRMVLDRCTAKADSGLLGHDWSVNLSMHVRQTPCNPDPVGPSTEEKVFDFSRNAGAIPREVAEHVVVWFPVVDHVTTIVACRLLVLHTATTEEVFPYWVELASRRSSGVTTGSRALRTRWLFLFILRRHH